MQLKSRDKEPCGYSLYLEFEALVNEQLKFYLNSLRIKKEKTNKHKRKREKRDKVKHLGFF